jgi:hypothetical protein
MKPLYTLPAFGVTVNLYADLSFDFGGIDPAVIRAYAALAGDDQSAAEQFANDHLRFPKEAIVQLMCHAALPMWEYRNIIVSRIGSGVSESRFLHLRAGTVGLNIAYRPFWFDSIYRGGHAFSPIPVEVGEGYAPQCPLRLSYAPRSVAVPYKGKHGWGVAAAREGGVE